MIWALLSVSVVLAWRLHVVERRLRSIDAAHHDAANRALVREYRNRWRWREADYALRRIASETMPGLDVPDLLAGPPDDPDPG